MDTWTKWTEFLACGLLVLPLTLGLGMDSFEIFALVLAPLLLLLILITILGAPTIDSPEDDESSHRPQGK